MQSTAGLFVCLAVLLAAVVSGDWCDYSCYSAHPNYYGSASFDTGIGSLPKNPNIAYTASSFQKICSASGTSLSDTLIPQLTVGDDNTEFLSKNFIVLCPEDGERSINFVSTSAVNSTMGVRFTVSIPGTDAIVSYLSNHGYIVVLTTTTMYLYSSEFDNITALWSFTPGTSKTGPAEFEGMPMISTEIGVFYVVARFGGNLVFVPINFDGSFSMVPVNFENSLPYAVLARGADVLYCSGEDIVKVSRTTNVVSTISLSGYDATCTAIILSSYGKVIVSAKVNSGNTTSFFEFNSNDLSGLSLIGEASAVVNAMTRTAFTDSVEGRVSFMALATDAGVEVMSDVFPGRERFTLLSKYETTENYPLRLPIAFTNLLNPVYANDEGIVAYSEVFMTKFFLPDVSLPDAGVVWASLDLFTPVMLLGGTGIVSTTRSGEVILFSQCTRYKLGAAVPDNACPIADLPDAAQVPTWIIITAGAGMVIALPIFSEMVCRKMKVVGKDKCEHDHEEEEEEESVAGSSNMPLHPVEKQQMKK